MTKSRTAPWVAVTYLAWLGGMSAKWMPRTTPRFETEVLRLREVERVPDGLLEAVEAVPLEEDAAVVAELLRGDLVAVGDLQFADLHGTTAYRASRSDAVVRPVSRPRAPSRPT